MSAPVQREKALPLWVALTLIAGIAILVYAQVYRFDFVYYDDDEYVFRNPQVISGLTPESVSWALTALVSKHWHPLTWLSHMLDVELFGLNPAGHHLVNLLLHLSTALLLFGFLVRTTGERVPALLVALVWTVHPLHVENVAWVADRKDLLCALFWMTALNAYAAYVKSPGGLRYAVVLLAFCLSLLAKSMAVTLPLVLLLLDFWPLQRHEAAHPGQAVGAGSRAARSGLGWLVFEKIPLFAISAAVGLVTLHALKAQHVYSPLLLPSTAPLVQGMTAFSVYLAGLVYPVGLITPYPVSAQITYWKPALSGALVLLATVGVLHRSRQHPYLALGWGWYLVTLLPVAGFYGPLRVADRYAYIPLIGIYILLFWSGAAAYRRWPRVKTPLLFTASVLVGMLAVIAHQQTAHWKNTLTLFQHTLDVNPSSSIARSNMGIYLHEHGRIDDAIRFHQEAAALAPHKPEYHYNLGLAHLYKQDFAKALSSFTRTTGLRPGYVAAMSNQGLCLLQLGKMEQARQVFEQVLTIDPDDIYANNHLGRYYFLQGNLSAAEAHLRKVLSVQPDRADALGNLAGTLAAGGDYTSAERFYREAIRIAPQAPGYYFGLARLLTVRKSYKEAADLRQKGLDRDPHNAEQHYFLAVDYYFAGDFVSAGKHLQSAKAMSYPGVENLFDQELTRALNTEPPQKRGNCR
ncbi:MAG: tetratricopeptide repeat protein [Pseudomonadota bacterium]